MYFFQAFLYVVVLRVLLTRAGSHTASCSQISGTKLINSGEALMQIPFHLIPQLASALHSIPSTDTALHYQVKHHHQQLHINLADLRAASSCCLVLRWNSLLRTRAKQMNCNVWDSRALQSKEGSCLQKGTYCGWFLWSAEVCLLILLPGKWISKCCTISCVAVYFCL